MSDPDTGPDHSGSSGRSGRPGPSGPELEAAWGPLALAMADAHRGRHEALLRVESDLWCAEAVPVDDYYRPDNEPLGPIDITALEHCQGRVLDIGAGAGRHTLELQRRGLDVVALDASAGIVELLRRRGVHQALHGDLYELRPASIGRFDTLLLMMHGIGFVGTLTGLGRFLEHARALMAPGASILADSADMYEAVGEDQLDSLRAAAEERSYVGEVEFRLAYRDVSGAPYPWLFVDPSTLTSIAEAHDFSCEIVATAERGAYLACLVDLASPAAPAPPAGHQPARDTPLEP